MPCHTRQQNNTEWLYAKCVWIMVLYKSVLLFKFIIFVWIYFICVAFFFHLYFCFKTKIHTKNRCIFNMFIWFFIYLFGLGMYCVAVFVIKCEWIEWVSVRNSIDLGQHKPIASCHCRNGSVMKGLSDFLFYFRFTLYVIQW